MTVTYWLGGVFGCSSPEQQASPQQTQADTPQVAVATQSASETRSSIHKFTRMPSESTPSLHSLDRSHWAKVTVTPLDGSIAPRPVMFEDGMIQVEHQNSKLAAEEADPLSHQAVDLSEVKLPAEDFSRVNKNTVEVQKKLVEALEGGEAQNWSQENGLNAVAQPIKAALDLVTLPLRTLADQEAAKEKAAQKKPETPEP